MGTLYVIGNGFDLNYKLKTTPEDFSNYLQKQHVYFDTDNALNVLSGYGYDWNKYEQSLNHLDLDALFEEHEEAPDYMSDYESDREDTIYNMEMYTDSISKALDSAMKKMVEAANDDIKRIKHLPYMDRLFKSGDAILSFNYTSTIESLFTIPDDVPLLHIHGYFEDGDTLIMGYKKDHLTRSYDTVPADEDNWDYYTDKQRERVYDLYKKLRKNYQVRKLKAFLAGCNGIDYVVVLGHSMGYVDSQYMELIEETLHPVCWDVSYYHDDEPQKILAQNYSFQIKINFSKIESLMEKHAQATDK